MQLCLCFRFQSRISFRQGLALSQSQDEGHLSSIALVNPISSASIPLSVALRGNLQQCECGFSVVSLVWTICFS